MLRTTVLLLMLVPITACGTLAATGAGRDNSQYGFNNSPAEQSDASISASVHRQLINDPVINASQISISTRQGVIILEGRVSSAAVRDRVISLCNRTTGVKQVISHLQVTQD